MLHNKSCCAARLFDGCFSQSPYWSDDTACKDLRDAQERVPGAPNKVCSQFGAWQSFSCNNWTLKMFVSCNNWEMHLSDSLSNLSPFLDLMKRKTPSNPSRKMNEKTWKQGRPRVFKSLPWCHSEPAASTHGRQGNVQSHHCYWWERSRAFPSKKLRALSCEHEI